MKWFNDFLLLMKIKHHYYNIIILPLVFLLESKSKSFCKNSKYSKEMNTYKINIKYKKIYK